MLATLRQLLEMIRFSHTLFALPFALLAAVMAWCVPVAEGRAVDFRLQDLAGILLCMVFARSAAMAFNRIADRKLDAANPRTAGRHLPAGRLSLGQVIAFTVVCSCGFVLSTLLFWPNPLPPLLAVPVLAFLFAYSFTKRFTAMAHFWLGAALMLAPLSAWIAIRGEAVMADPGDLIPPLTLGVAVMLWVGGFDIIYACQDAEFDARARLKSVPARLGIRHALRLAAGCHLGMILVLACLPRLAPQVPFGAVYATGVIAAGLLLAYEHWLVRPDDLARVNIAFLHLNALISVGLFLVGTIDLLI